MQKQAIEIPVKLKQLREKYKYTQQDVADFLSIDQSAYAKIESGKISLDIQKAITLSKVYKDDINVLDLLPLEKSLVSNLINQGNGTIPP